MTKEEMIQTIQGTLYAKKVKEKYGKRIIVYDSSLTDNERDYAFELVGA